MITSTGSDSYFLAKDASAWRRSDTEPEAPRRFHEYEKETHSKAEEGEKLTGYSYRTILSLRHLS